MKKRFKLKSHFTLRLIRVCEITRLFIKAVFWPHFSADDIFTAIWLFRAAEWVQIIAEAGPPNDDDRVYLPEARADIWWEVKRVLG